MTILDGDTSFVSDLLTGVQKKNRVYVLVVPSGAKAGYTSAVILRTLKRFGISADKFAVVVGTSAGFINGLAACAGQEELTPEIYLHLANKPWFFPTYGVGGWLTFHQYLLAILQGHVWSDIRLDTDAIMACPARKVCAVSDLYGQISYPEVHSAGDVFKYIYAASSVLPFTVGMTINGRMVVDGAYAHAHCQFARIIRKLMRDGGPEREVCVLFVANRPHIEHQHPWENPVYTAGMLTTLCWAPWLLKSALAFDAKVARSEKLFKRPERRRTRLCGIFPSPAEQTLPWEWRPREMEQSGRKLDAALTRVFEAL